MNNSSPFLWLLITGMILSSFTRQKISLEKIWIYDSFDGALRTWTYTQQAKFQEKMCLQFLPDGKMWVKQNVSGCGTTFPGEKIQYEIVEGTWELNNDSVILLNYTQFGLDQTEHLRIIELSENKLVVRKEM